MSHKRDKGCEPQHDDGDDVETSKLGVLVPEDVQKDNRSLVLYRNDGAKRNKLGPGTTDRITHGLAMYFWRHPSELEKVAHSEYVDDPEGFKKRIQQYQNEHIEDTLVVARNLLHSSRGENEMRPSNKPVSAPQDENAGHPVTIGEGSMKQNRLGGVPRIEDAPQDKTVTQEEQERARNELEEELASLVQREMREQMEIFERKFENRLSNIENAEDPPGDNGESVS